MSVPSRAPRDIRWLRAIFGRYASAEKGRILLRALVIVASVDFATKLLAVALLKEGESVSLFGGAIEFDLVFNPTTLGTLTRLRSPEYVLGASAVWLTGSVLAFGFAEAESRIRSKVAFVSVLILLVAILAAPVGNWLYQLIGVAGLPPIRILGNLAFTLFALRLARSKVLFSLLATITAANLANIATLFLWPAGVVDFLKVPLLGRFFGIANLADYVMTLGLLLVVAFVPLRLAVACLRSLDSLALQWVDVPLATDRSYLVTPKESG
jgi:lipoprotein signal peptidase